MGKWLVRRDSIGRREPPSALCDACADNGFASPLGLWIPNASGSVRCNIFRASGSAKRRETVAGEYKSRRDPATGRRDISSVCPLMTELRRASPAELRTAFVRVKKRLPPSNTSGIGDALGRGGEVPPDGASLLLMTAQFAGARSQTEKVALESVDRICLSRAPQMEYKYLLAGGVRSTNKALEYSRHVAKQTGDPLARAVAGERGFICEFMRILFTPCAPPGTGLAPPTIRPGGLIQTSAVLRTLSRVVKDAARVETPPPTSFRRMLRVSVEI